jgi:hypothetical protein
MLLSNVALARSGDKGDTSDITVIARRPEDYATLRRLVTSERVDAHFADLGSSAVERFELPQLHALKFVLHDALDGGVTSSLNLDAHGKCLGSCLLDMEIPDD